MIDSIFNEDCKDTISKIIERDIKVDLVLTSPPYNTSRQINTKRSLETHNGRYDIYVDDRSQEEYCEWVDGLFRSFDKMLKPNGVVLWNTSYGTDITNNNFLGIGLQWLSVADIIRNTPFIVADRIIWKKLSALPNNVSPNKLTRICEDVFVFCRKEEIGTFFCNKGDADVGKNGQKYYRNVFNMIKARNNDGANPYNKATYSSDLCRQLMDLYCPTGGLVYDPFMGTGTTAVACVQQGNHYIGSELSENQCTYAVERIKRIKEDMSSIFDI